MNTRPRKAAGEISEAEVAVTVAISLQQSALDGAVNLFSTECINKSESFAELTKAWTLGQEAGVPVFALIEGSALSEIRGLLGRHRFDRLLAEISAPQAVRDFERPVHTDLSFNVFIPGPLNFWPQRERAWQLHL